MPNRLSYRLREFSAHAKVRASDLLIVLKSYFDGGSQADSQEYQILTLAALAGAENGWNYFDEAWSRVLRKYRAPYLHTTDAVALAKPFSKNNGWSREKVNSFINDCAAVLGFCEGWNIRPITVSVLLPDFKRILFKIPDTPPVELVCAIHCLGLALIFGQAYLREPKMALFFDRGEPFCGHILDRWNNKKITRTNATWKSIIQVGQADMLNVPALQAADLLAWSVNHAHQEKYIRYDWQERVLAVPRSKEWFDEEKLSKPKLDALQALKRLRLPTRRPMR